MASTKVKANLDCLARSGAIRATERCSDFPVLVCFTAAEWRHAVPTQRTGVDVVALLNTRSSLPGERLELIKQAMMTIVNKLGADDRLSMVSLGTNVHRLTELTYMSDHGRDAARLKVDQLETKGSDGTQSALVREGDLILRGRETEGSSGRVGCMMFLSAGDCGEAVVESSDFPVYTLGLGAEHDPKHMKHIADETCGTYYALMERQEEGMINIMAGLLLPVTARSVKITVRAHEGVAISSIESGGYGQRVSPDKLSGEINMSNIYAGEEKNFIVYLNIAEGDQGKLVTIGGWYNGCKQLPESDVKVRREEPELRGSLNYLVARELVRLRLEKGVSAMVEEKEEEAACGDGLQQLWDDITKSVEGDLGYQCWWGPESDLAEMNKSGLPYMLSWLSRQKWQRGSNAGAYQDKGVIWLKLEPSVTDMIIAMGSQEIDSYTCLDGAAAEDMKRNLDTQLFEAIMHASTILSTCLDEYGIKRDAQAYLQDMLDRVENIKHFKYVQSNEHNLNQMNRSLYRAILQASSLTGVNLPPKAAPAPALVGMEPTVPVNNALRFFWSNAEPPMGPPSRPTQPIQPPNAVSFFW